MSNTTKLNSLRTSISNAIGRGRRINNSRQLSRIDAYEGLKDTMLATSAGQKEWEDYCKSNGLYTAHTAYDFFA